MIKISLKFIGGLETVLRVGLGVHHLLLQCGWSCALVALQPDARLGHRLAPCHSAPSHTLGNFYRSLALNVGVLGMTAALLWLGGITHMVVLLLP